VNAGTMARDELSLVQDALARIVSDGRIGKPRYVQCLFRADDAASHLDRLLRLSEAVFGSPADNVHKQSSCPGHLTAAVRWPGGESALLTVFAPAAKQRFKLDLVLLGSLGAIYYSSPDA
jgi:hypothetical protein